MLKVIWEVKSLVNNKDGSERGEDFDQQRMGVSQKMVNQMMCDDQRRRLLFNSVIERDRMREMASQKSLLRDELIETNTSYILTIDLPGVDKKDAIVTVSKGVVIIVAERKANIDKESGKSFGSNYKTRHEINIPLDAEENSVDAELKDGVLNVYLKKDLKKVSHQVEIK